MAHLTANDMNIYKIARTIGHATRDLGKLCTSVKNNMFSRFKPMFIPTTVADIKHPTAQDFAGQHYGVYGAAYEIGTLFALQNAWTYDRPQSPYLRKKDFVGYLHKAIPPFMQAMGAEVVVDVVRDDPGSFGFYLFFNAGRLANRKFLKGGGLDPQAAQLESGDVAYNVAVEDLVFNTGASEGVYSGYVSLLDGNDPSYLGLVIFSSTGQYKTELFATSGNHVQEVPTGGTYSNDMFRINLAPLATSSSIGTLPIGTYKAIACARQVNGAKTYYLPVYPTGEFPAKFNLDIGGMGRYKVSYIGVGESASGPFETSLPVSVTTRDVYIKLRLYNYSGSLLTLAAGTQKFILKTGLVGNVTPGSGGSSYPVDRTVTSGSYIGIGTAVQIADGTFAELVYQVPNIWSETGADTPQIIEGGSLTLTPTLRLNGDVAFTPTSSSYSSFTVTA